MVHPVFNRILPGYIRCEGDIALYGLISFFAFVSLKKYIFPSQYIQAKKIVSVLWYDGMYTEQTALTYEV